MTYLIKKVGAVVMLTSIMLVATTTNVQAYNGIDGNETVPASVKHLSLKETERLIVAGDFDKAQKELDSVPSADKKKLEWQLLTARLLVASNKLEKANNKIQALLQQYPNKPQVHYWSAMINGNLAKQASIFKAGAFAKKSKKAFIKSIDVDPSYVQGYQGLIQFYLQAPAIAGGSTKKAIGIANKLVKVNPLQGQLSLLKIAQDIDDDHWEAELIATIQSQFVNDAEAQFAVGFYFQAKEQFEKAYVAFNKAANSPIIAGTSISEDERFAKLGALYQLGRNAVFSNLHVEEGIAALQKYLGEATPTTLPSKAWANYRLSKLYVMNKQQDLAKPILISLNNEKYGDDLVDLVRDELKRL